MKYFIIILLPLFTLLANDAKQKVTLGVGAYVQTQPYKDVTSIVVPSPVIFFDNSLFYVRWSRAGIYFLGDKNDDYAWGFSITAEPRPFGFKPSDSNAVKNLDERETSFEGGIAFSASMQEKYIEIMALTDLLREHNAWLLKAEIGDKYRVKNFSFYPSITLSYQSDAFMNYYYGVSQKEALHSKYNFYKAEAGFQFGVQTYIKYPLTNKLSTLINLRADLLPKSAKDTPIVEQNSIYSGLVSLIYTFEY